MAVRGVYSLHFELQATLRARNSGTLKTAWWQFLSLLGVTGFDKVSLRWAASRGLLAT